MVIRTGRLLVSEREIWLKGTLGSESVIRTRALFYYLLIHVQGQLKQAGVPVVTLRC